MLKTRNGFLFPSRPNVHPPLPHRATDKTKYGLYSTLSDKQPHQNTSTLTSPNQGISHNVRPHHNHLPHDQPPHPHAPLSAPLRLVPPPRNFDSGLQYLPPLHTVPTPSHCQTRAYPNTRKTRCARPRAHGADGATNCLCEDRNYDRGEEGGVSVED